jgi:hypothetical protein
VYYIYGISGPFPLIQAIDSMIYSAQDSGRMVKVFAGYTLNILCISINLQVPERLHQGPEFSHDYPCTCARGKAIIVTLPACARDKAVGSVCLSTKITRSGDLGI